MKSCSGSKRTKKTRYHLSLTIFQLKTPEIFLIKRKASQKFRIEGFGTFVIKCKVLEM